METIDIIKDLCKKKGITIQTLETELGEKRTSIATATSNMKAEKLYKIAQYFGVSMEFIMGKADIIPKNRHNLSFEHQSLIDAYDALDESQKDLVCNMLKLKRDLLLLKEEFNGAV